jgi:O-antigen/teichoic acid export membrane protein
MFSVLPGFKEYIDLKHWQKARTLLNRIWKIMLVAGVLLVAGGSLFGGFAIELLTHKKYILPEFWFVLPLMLLLAAVSYGYDMILIMLFALDEDLWLLKREFAALGLASVLFIASYLVIPPEGRLLLILCGSIVGETFMVASGLVRIGQIFRSKSIHEIQKY